MVTIYFSFLSAKFLFSSGHLVSNTDYVCVPSCFSHVWLFANLWTIAYQAPLSIGILLARILEWAATPSSRGSSWPRDWTWVSYVSCITKQILYHLGSQNTGAGCHFLLQGIFPAHGPNPGPLHCRHILYLLSHQGSPYFCSRHCSGP